MLQKAGGEKEFEPIVGMELYEGTTIITGKNAQVTLLIDGSKEVKVAEKSYVTIEELSEEEENEITGIRLFAGKIWSKIKEKLGIGDQYEIRTPNSIMGGARGTKYVVSYEVEEDAEKSVSKVTVIEGVVKAQIIEKFVQDLDEDDGSQQEDDQEGNQEGNQEEAGSVIIVAGGEQSSLKPSAENESDKVQVSSPKFGDYDLFTIDAIIEDLKENPPEEYDDSDKVLKDLEEVRPDVEEKEALEDQKEEEASEVLINYDNQEPPLVDTGSTSGGSSNSTLSSIDVIEDNLTMTLGDASKQLTYRYIPSSASAIAVGWESSDTTIATVTDSGVVEAVGTGSVSIKAYTVDGVHSDNCAITIDSKLVGDISVTAVDIVESSVDVYKTATKYLNVSITPSNASNHKVTWDSSNTGVATVDSAGKVTGTGVGNATITATSVDGSLTDVCQVNVSKKPVTSVNINESSVGLDKDDTITLTAQALPGDAYDQTISWSTSDATIASVNSSSGLVTANKVGSVTITATSVSGSLTDTCTVNVSEPVISVTGFVLAESTKSLKVTESFNLTPLFTPSNASNQSIVWSSDNDTAATVDGAGKVTAVTYGVGVARITGTTLDGDISSSCDVTIDKNSVTSVSLPESTIGITTGGSYQLNEQISPVDATDQGVTWSSSDTGVASVSNGLVTAEGVGTATITVESNESSSIKATCSVEVTASTVSVTGITIDQTSLAMAPGGM